MYARKLYKFTLNTKKQDVSEYEDENIKVNLNNFSTHSEVVGCSLTYI